MLPFIKVNDEVVIVSGFIGSLKVAVIILFKDTLVAVLKGSVEITRGAKVLPVVKLQT